jgi:putative transposase
MEQVYPILDITRQAYHKAVRKQSVQKESNRQLIHQAERIRMKHRRMGCRKIASRIKIRGYGRDKTERVLLQSGFRIARKIKHVKTTQRQREMYFPNLIEGLILKGKNQVIQTDITYFIIGENHYYIVFIMDVYTRLITGYNVSDSLKASENIKALEMAFKARAGDNLTGMIHHSDKGSQYIDKDYLSLIGKYNVSVSMCDYAWENAYCERINRTIKEEYLETREIKNLNQLKKEVKRAVHLYNQERGHDNLYKQMSPEEFEQYLLTIDAGQYPQMKLYEPPEEVMNKKVNY